MGQGGMMGASSMMDQRLRLADAHGTVLVDTSSTDVGSQLSQADLSNAVQLHDGTKLVGYLLAEGGFTLPQSDQTDLYNRLNRAALTAALIGGAVALLLALLLSFGLLRPIHALTQASRALAGGDLSKRVPVHGSDELAQLGQSFNQMVESLQNAEGSRRALTADIAHELRTPLAVQRAHLEALQDGVYPLTAENLDPVLAQNQLLTRLVDDLRTLALAESGQLSLIRTPVDFPALTQRVVERFQPQAEARQVQLQMVAEGLPSGKSALLELDSARMEQILGNLLANALRYTPEGGQVQVHLEWSPKIVHLSVCDSGPGIPPEALPHIFERFYRADKSRTRSEGGTGLGLAIARQLAEAHGGTLTAENLPEGGAKFILTLRV